MAALADAGQAPARRQQADCYVYGIVPADAELVADIAGVGNPPGQVHLVRYQDIAAVVSEVSIAGPLGTPQDLRAHAQLLDAIAAAVPVLPFRFGAVMTDEDAVASELLEAHHDDLMAALAQIEGRAEFVVKGRYAGQVVLAEVLGEVPEAARLAGQIRGTSEHATRPARMHLGEIINHAITAKRQADTQAAGDAVAPYCVASVVRQPTHELDAVNVALLVEAAQQAALERAITELASSWRGRIELRLLGPLAPWDFVQAPAPPQPGG